MHDINNHNRAAGKRKTRQEMYAGKQKIKIKAKIPFTKTNSIPSQRRLAAAPYSVV